MGQGGRLEVGDSLLESSRRGEDDRRGFRVVTSTSLVDFWSLAEAQPGGTVL